MPRTVLEVGGITDIGMVRTRNEDSMGTLTIPDEALYSTKGQLFIVCDGMGGHAAGNVASRMAVEKVNQAYYFENFSPNPGENLEYAIKVANKEIFEEASRNPEYFRMGTTFVGIIIFGDEAYVANVGDSRGYMVRGEEISQVTKDHSWVALQVEMGEMTQEEAESSQNRSILLRCLGEKPDVLVDSKVLKLQKGDSFILCSDGLHGLVANDEIKLRATEMDAQSACQALTDLANSRGGH
ncbi:MAG: PP2C family protein-serine/threonine phosphatase, partial [Candidatus Xenobia bacterium]